MLSQVSAQELYAFFLRQIITNLSQQVMLLVGTDEQGGGVSIKAPLVGHFCGFRETEPETMLAALGFIPGYPAEVLNNVVTFGSNERQGHFPGVGFGCGQTLLVLQIGVDIGVVPQGAGLIPLLTPVLNGIGSAVSAAAMNQNRINLHTRCQIIKGLAGVAFVYYRADQGVGMHVESPVALAESAPENPAALDRAHRHP